MDVINKLNIEINIMKTKGMGATRKIKCTIYKLLETKLIKSQFKYFVVSLNSKGKYNAKYAACQSMIPFGPRKKCRNKQNIWKHYQTNPLVCKNIWQYCIAFSRLYICKMSKYKLSDL